MEARERHKPKLNDPNITVDADHGKEAKEVRSETGFHNTPREPEFAFVSDKKHTHIGDMSADPPSLSERTSSLAPA